MLLKGMSALPRVITGFGARGHEPNGESASPVHNVSYIVSAFWRSRNSTIEDKGIFRKERWLHGEAL